MSAERTDDGGFAIDPAELQRVYPATGRNAVAKRTAGHDATPPATTQQADPATRPDLDAEIARLRELLELERARSAEIRQERDRWHAQAERLALLAPPPQPTVPPSRSWWRRLVG